MQITETVNEGLHREFKVVIPQGDLDKRLTTRVEEIKPQMSLKGFRPGKAPLSHLKKTFGKQIMSEIVEQAVSESSQKAVADNSLKPATPPSIDLVSELAQVMDGKSDLEFTVKVDLMPEFDVTDPSKLHVERLVADVTDAEVDEAVERLAQQSRSYTPRGDGEKAEKDDAVVIDFVGSIDGTEFPGGKADDFNLTLGSGQLIPGFEDQLIGAKVGDEREVKVTFPTEYQEASLAGKDAVFVTKVKQVSKPDELQIDDELAKKLGLDSLGTLKERVREQLKSDFSRASRLHMKRRILDALDEAHDFALPPKMVEAEFDGIWRAVEAELQREGKKPEDEGKTEDELKKEYREIAERRVRLGLVLAKLGEQNGITVGAEEVNRAIAQRARQFPGQEQQVFQFYATNQQAQAEIRAPLYEDKVVDFIAELATVTDKTVDRETLFMDPDEAAEKMKAEKTEKPEKKTKKAKKSDE
ncbi:MAG TPA: trigger factor [Rhizomicrobium sp.]|jgi:trigger factor|nr:trigger factor [Rhizomicrobium sp.]